MTEKRRGAPIVSDEAVKNAEANAPTEEGQAAPAGDAAAASATKTPAKLVGPYWTMEEY